MYCLSAYIYIRDKTYKIMELTNDLILHPAIFLIIAFTLATLGLKIYVIAKSGVKAQTLLNLLKVARFNSFSLKRRIVALR
jgi:hypothetical protein